MPSFLFWLFAIVMLVFGALVVINRNPIASALSLVVCFLGLSALFMSLDAFFIGIIQVLVYAGAVMVLFLFVIMLLDLRAEERQRVRVFSAVSGLIAVGAILLVFLQTLLQGSLGSDQSPSLEGSTIHLGHVLCTRFLLPFEIVSLLLLVAMVGVILLSKKDLK